MFFFFFLMIRRPPRSTQSRSSAASDVYKRQFITLVESAIPRQLGFDITTDAEIRTDAFLFGEAQGRIVVSVSPSRETQFIDHMIAKGIPFTTLGHVTKSEVRIDDESYGFIADIKREYENAFTTLMEGK